MRLKEQYEHLQLILSIGGGAASQNFATVAATAATRDNFGRSAKGLVDASGFNGIDSKILPFLEKPTDHFKSIGNTRLTPSRVETFSPCLRPSASISRTINTSSLLRYRPTNGHCRISIFIRLKIISTTST